MTPSKARLASASLALTIGAAGLSLAVAAPSSAADQVHPAGASDSGAYLAPFYTEGDLTGDHQITAADLDIARAALGTSSTGAGWSKVAAADLDGDGTITIADLARLAQKVIYDDGSFDLIEASALDMQKAMNAGVITSVQLTQDYLDRITAYNSTTVDPATSGRPLNAVITADAKDALAAAAASDAARKKNGHGSGMLDGIPILLKDNYDTKDMPTSAGCSCWEDNQTSTDATMVAGLRDAGAIILGKASMDEFAYGFVSQYSAGSPVGSSKYVASPYNTAQSAGGSSGGTGASISANLGAIGFGTDTGGSIRVPSSYNQLVGLRPTVGLTSRDGIVPLALTQDTGGPIARSVSDVAVALDAVVGSDPADAATSEADTHLPTSYTSYLKAGSLAGKHFAYFTSMVPPSSATSASQIAARRIFLDAVQKLQDAGATVDAIDPSTLAADPANGVTVSKILNEGSGSTNEFKANIAAYVANHLDPTVADRTLAEIVSSGQYTPQYGSVYTQRDAVTTDTYNAWMASHGSLIKNGSAYLTNLMDTDDIDAVIYPTTTTYGTYSTNLRLSPNTGMPAITVPAGQDNAGEVTAGAPANANVNLEFLGRDYDEGDLISYGYSFEQATKARTTPALYPALAGETYAGPGVDEDAPGTGAVTLGASARTVKPGQTFSVTVDESAKDLYAYDLSLGFDPKAAALVSTSTTGGTTGSDVITAGSGTVHVVHTKLGSSPAAEGDTKLVTLTFKALAVGATAHVSVTKLVTVDADGDATAVVEPGGASVGITAYSTTTSASLAKHAVTSGKKVRLNVAVSAAPGVVPTGSVKVTVAGKSHLATLNGGRAVLTFKAPKLARKVKKAKTKKISVVYAPTADFTGSATTLTLKVKPKH
ncbi:amidase family protein [Nocardioides sp. BP30]|uniref:amidase family protein n=1 Tax=Nocardioides sp. BP30 TaxID=3036374 RepID=UPI0024689921|nr:amidase family protein [Nocardioides sp. BP30]WGL52357.1 amidase family protein [Nocardioides sp. BP30]